jgi:hypothetical protein
MAVKRTLLIDLRERLGEILARAGPNYHLTKPVAVDALIGILDPRAKLDFAP